MQKISVLIPTYNEAANIADCLESVRWADQVMVVDSFSSDDTVNIARRWTDCVLQHPYEGPAAQKNWALPQAAHPWVLIVDADERIPEPLAQEIRQVLAQDGPCDGYWIRRRNLFLGREIRASGWQHDRVLRLFRRDRGRYQPQQVHESLLVEGQVGTLRHPMLHHSYRDLHAQFAKTWRYSGWGAQEARKQGRRPRWWRLALEPGLVFWQGLLLRGGWRDGMHGLVICGFRAVGVFTKYARLWEMELQGSQEPMGPRHLDPPEG